MRSNVSKKRRGGEGEDGSDPNGACVISCLGEVHNCYVVVRLFEIAAESISIHA